MPDDVALPIVFRPKPRDLTIAYVLAAFLIGVGVWQLTVQFDKRPGGFILALGLLLAFGLWRGFGQSCPVLELRADAIVYTRCLRAPRRIAWEDIASVTLWSDWLDSEGGGRMEREGAQLVLRSGEKVNIEAFPSHPAQEIRDAILRAAQLT